jgi:hypothetical protein
VQVQICVWIEPSHFAEIDCSLWFVWFVASNDEDVEQYFDREVVDIHSSPKQFDCPIIGLSLFHPRVDGAFRFFYHTDQDIEREQFK